METVYAVAGTIARHLWSVSWQVSILIGVIWLIDRLSVRASSLFRYWLWCIVLVRLCIPGNLIFSAFHSTYIRKHIGIGINNLHIKAPINSTAVFEILGNTMGLSTSAVSHYAGLAWLVLVMLVSVLIMVKILVIGRHLRAITPVIKPEICRLFERLTRNIGIERPVELYTMNTDTISLPAVTGVFRTRVILPAAMVSQWSVQEIEPILLHELAHVRRHDLIINWLQVFIEAVYFFHPLVWYVNRKIRHIREELCDDLVITHLGPQWKSYILSILRVMEETAEKPALGFVRVELSARKNNIKERIKRIMSTHYSPHRCMTVRSIILLLVLVTLSISLSFAGDDVVVFKKDGIVLTKTADSAQQFSLEQNYPNPADTMTTFLFSLPEKNSVTLTVYDHGGNKVAGLLDRELPGGEYKLEWSLQSRPAGIYFYRIEAGSFDKIMKMTIL